MDIPGQGILNICGKNRFVVIVVVDKKFIFVIVVLIVVFVIVVGGVHDGRGGDIGTDTCRRYAVRLIGQCVLIRFLAANDWPAACCFTIAVHYVVGVLSIVGYAARRHFPCHAIRVLRFYES